MRKDKPGNAVGACGFFSFAPLIVFSPFAGVLVDRWNRKLVMALSDIGAGFVTLSIFILMLTGKLEIWHLYITGVIGGVFGAFQWPAYSAAISLLVPKKHYTRTSGMISMAESGVGILAPILAGILLPLIGVTGIITIDIITLVIALVFLLAVIVPEPEREVVEKVTGHFFRELAYGFQYILDRKSLLFLQLVFFFGNFFSSVGLTVFTPMVLASTGSDSTILGTVYSAGAIGGLVGGLLLTAWGGPKKKIDGVLFGWLVCGLLGLCVIGLGRAAPYWMIGYFSVMFFSSLINGANQAIWQSKVAPAVQGRVFSVRRFIAQITAPVSMVIAGPLADRVFEPGLAMPSSSLAPFFGSIFGTGAGAGMSLLIFLCGVLIVGVSLAAYSSSQVRYVETLIPDHDDA